MAFCDLSTVPVTAHAWKCMWMNLYGERIFVGSLRMDLAKKNFHGPGLLHLRYDTNTSAAEFGSSAPATTWGNELSCLSLTQHSI